MRRGARAAWRTDGWGRAIGDPMGRSVGGAQARCGVRNLAQAGAANTFSHKANQSLKIHFCHFLGNYAMPRPV
jgi:hypothetical protein